MNTYVVDCCDLFDSPENIFVILMANSKEEAIEKVQTKYPRRKTECTGPVTADTFMEIAWGGTCMTFERSNKTIEKQTLDGLESGVDIIHDAEVKCEYDGHVYYEVKGPKNSGPGGYFTLESFRVQFPKHLRGFGKRYITDLKYTQREGQAPFYSAYKGTIRELDGRVVG